MDFEPTLQPATLVRRYKRFLADVVLDDGSELTVHCPNTGAMTGCAEPGWRVWLSRSDSKTRKYPHTWELVETDNGIACVHSARANKVVAEAIADARVPALAGYEKLQTEVKYGAGSRADLWLSSGDRHCVVEVKSVTLCRDAGAGVFPDAVSTRATKHLQELQAVVESGQRAVIFYCVFHEGIKTVSAATDIDPVYAATLQAAMTAGVEAMAWSCRVSAQGISLHEPLPVLPPKPDDAMLAS
ncbi:DNA/RNA nuclease SfsA [Halieaceae bacterium IMCC14734]|uniref:Sugar fermentation stimulation protein homolog n=1 Tax=Candidatus Litorirhabdus singularis TaxID=2518993 RepID=A0ABT3TL94_9GAMM|nr:DNA/RNA nuclease SfsA [Candidatus Litorirhabdus singularis]MCX2983092.1 DNA/RNA nuclease SfsA [Candidatus Litorirhabdus singularis]